MTRYEIDLLQLIHTVLYMKALKFFLEFLISYLCELTFSAITNIKIKKRKTITNLNEELRVATSNIQQNILYVTVFTI